MAIAEMLRVAIVGLTEDSSRISEIMQRHGAVQIEASVEEEPQRRLSEVTDMQAKAMRSEELAMGLKAALDFMDKQQPVKKGMLDTFIGWHYRIGEDEYERHVAGGEAKAEEIASKARGIETRLNGISNEAKAIDAEIAALKPWKALDVSFLELKDLKHHSFVIVTYPAGRSGRAIDELIKGFEGDAAYSEIARDEKAAYGIIAVAKQDTGALSQYLAQSGMDSLPMPESRLAPALEIKRLEARKAELASEEQRAKQEAVKLCELRPAAFSLHDHFSNEKSRYETAGSFFATDRAFAVDGWIRKDLLEGLKKELSAKAPSAVVMSRGPEEGEDAPVDLINKGIFAPFEAVTRIMGLPRQGTIDPTPLLAVFFFIYFGTCMGDAIYGLIMTGLGLLMLRKIKTAGMGTQLLQLLVVGGIATILMGVLFGGYFGDLFIKYLKPLWFDPMSTQGPMMFLAFSFGMGIVQILFGMAIKAWDNLRQGKWLSAIYDQGFWVILLLGSGLLIGGGAIGPGFQAAGKWMTLAGAAGLILTQGRHHKNPVVKLGSGVVSLYNITSYMSDIVSYSRLFGLGFTSIVIGMVINYMAKMMLDIPYVGYVLFFVVLVFGHMFNLFINITGAFIHSSRLQYVEFFGKFADFGGTKYTPFRKFNKYVDIDFKEAK